jgi:putative tricarboxylic transport membrane protein
VNKGQTPAQRRPLGAALVIAAALAGLGVIMLLDSSRIAEVGGYSQVGPATVPRIIAFCLLGLAVWTVVAGIRGDVARPDPQQFGPLFWITGGLAAQLLLLNVAGFSIATGILFAATARAFGKQKLLTSLAIGIVFSFVVWAIFSQLLQLNLPAGPLERLFF